MKYVSPLINDVSKYTIVANSFMEGKVFGNIKINRVLRKPNHTSKTTSNYVVELKEIYSEDIVIAPYSTVLREIRGFGDRKNAVRDVFNHIKAEARVANAAYRKTPTVEEVRKTREKFGFDAVVPFDSRDPVGDVKSVDANVKSVAQPVSAQHLSEGEIFNFLLDVVKLAKSNKHLADTFKKLAGLV